MIRWRWACGKRKGRWHDTKEAAEDAAVREGLGYRNDYAGPNGKRTFHAGPLTRIESDPAKPSR